MQPQACEFDLTDQRFAKMVGITPNYYGRNLALLFFAIATTNGKKQMCYIRDSQNRFSEPAKKGEDRKN